MLLSVGKFVHKKQTVRNGSRKDIVFKSENNIKSNMKVILPREDVVFKLPGPQITGSPRCPFLRFNFNFEL